MTPNNLNFPTGTTHHNTLITSPIHINLYQVVPEGILLTPTMLQKLKYFSRNDYNQNKELIFNGTLSKEWNGKQDVYRVLLGPSSEDGAIPIKIFCRNSLEEMEFDNENERDPFVELNFKNCNPSRIVNFETFLPIQMQVCWEDDCLHVSGELILPSTQYKLTSMGQITSNVSNTAKLPTSKLSQISKSNTVSTGSKANLRLAPNALSQFLRNKNRAHQIASGYITIDHQGIQVLKEDDPSTLQTIIDGVWISGIDLSLMNNIQYLWSVFTRFRHTRLSRRDYISSESEDESKFIVVIFPHPTYEDPHVFLVQPIIQDEESSNDDDNYLIFPCSAVLPIEQEIMDSVLLRFENIQDELSPDIANGGFSSEESAQAQEQITKTNLNHERTQLRERDDIWKKTTQDTYTPLSNQSDSLHRHTRDESNLQEYIHHEKLIHRDGLQQQAPPHQQPRLTNQVYNIESKPGQYTNIETTGSQNRVTQSFSQSEIPTSLLPSERPVYSHSENIATHGPSVDTRAIISEQMQQGILLQQLLQSMNSLQLEFQEMKKLISIQSNNQGQIGSRIEQLTQLVHHSISQTSSITKLSNNVETRTIGTETEDTFELIKQYGSQTSYQSSQGSQIIPNRYQEMHYSHPHIQGYLNPYSSPSSYQNVPYGISSNYPIYTTNPHVPSEIDAQRYYNNGHIYANQAAFPLQDPSIYNVPNTQVPDQFNNLHTEIHSSPNYLNSDMYELQTESQYESQMSNYDYTPNSKHNTSSQMMETIIPIQPPATKLSPSKLESQKSNQKTFKSPSKKHTNSNNQSTSQIVNTPQNIIVNKENMLQTETVNPSQADIRKNPLLTPKNQKSRKLHDTHDDSHEYDESTASIQIPSLIVSQDKDKAKSNTTRPPLSAKKINIGENIMSPVTPSMKKSKKIRNSVDSNSILSSNDETIPRIHFNPEDDDDDSTTYGDLISTPMSSNSNATMDLDESNWLTPGAKNYLNRHQLQSFSPNSPNLR